MWQKRVPLAYLGPLHYRKRKRSFAAKNLSAADIVAFSGVHTFGIGHCCSFTNKLCPSQDPTLDKIFANNLHRICPTTRSTNTTVLDIRTPKMFDHKYPDNWMRGIVTSFAIDQDFWERFVSRITKMGQQDVGDLA